MTGLARKAGSALTRARKQITGETGLEETLVELMGYGRPSLYCHDDLTWSATVTLNTDSVGLDGQCKSGFNHPTPGSAALAVLDRCKSLGK